MGVRPYGEYLTRRLTPRLPYLKVGAIFVRSFGLLPGENQIE